jgi:RNA polymerase sigma factor (sigma-70 family)
MIATSIEFDLYELNEDERLMMRQESTELTHEEGVLAKVARRTPGSLEACIDRYGPLVWSLARRLSPTQADAEDAVQEIFLDLWQKADRYDHTGSAESTFITMIARRKLIDRHRRTNRSIETVGMGDRNLELFEPVEPSIEMDADIADEAAKATRCLESLQPKPREVLRRSIHLGKSHSQISSELDLPLGTVKSFARRGLIQLRECMDRFSVGGFSGKEVAQS